MKIEFDKEESDKRNESGWNWFYGTVTDKEKEYPFTLCEMNTEVGGQNTTAIEITWVYEIPENATTLEILIKEKFEEEFE
jgi:hypothetical protein